MKNFNRSDKFSDKRGFGGKKPDQSKKMYQTTCSNCGNDCEVPFKPTGDRPILCSNCFAKKRGDRHQRSSGRDSGREKTMHAAVCDNCGDKCEVPFRPTSGKPVYCSKCFDQMGDGSRNKGGGGRDSSNESHAQLKEQIAGLNAKLDQILEAVTKKPTTKAEAAAKPKKAAAAKKTVKKPAKKAAAKKKK